MTDSISILIPFLNEAQNFPRLVLELNAYFAYKPYKAQVIFIDDGSTDQSVSILQQQRFDTFSAKIIKLSKNYGAHSAVRAGLNNSDSDYCMFLPADLQDPLSLIDECYQKIKEGGAEIVFANRKNTNNSFFERTFSRFYAYLMIKFVHPKYPSKGFDVVFFSKKVKSLLNQNIEANSSVFIQILTLGYKQMYIEYDKNARKIGNSKWTISKKIKLLIDSFVAFSFAPIRFVSLIGIVLFIFGILWTILIIWRKITLNDMVSGWPATTSILLLGFGITNISLGILAEYLWRTLDAARKRPVFIIGSLLH